jgi:hypothetical protein
MHGMVGVGSGTHLCAWPSCISINAAQAQVSTLFEMITSLIVCHTGRQVHSCFSHLATGNTAN